MFYAIKDLVSKNGNLKIEDSVFGEFLGDLCINNFYILIPSSIRFHLKSFYKEGYIFGLDVDDSIGSKSSIETVKEFIQSTQDVCKAYNEECFADLEKNQRKKINKISIL